MAVNVMSYLVIIALFGFIRMRMRYDRFLSWMMFIGTAFLFARYSIAAAHEQNLGFTFLWSPTRIGDITISFIPNLTINTLIIPLFFISLMTILNNNIFRYEEKRCTFNAYIILNFVMLCLLVAAQNYVQLITAVFISDILGYLILKDVDAAHRYVIYNLFADMCLFMILAMACGKVQSLEVSSLFNYEQIGRHKDFVGLITVAALFIKTGCFLFQSYLFDLSKARFQRMSAVNLLFSPLCGLILLMRLHNLITISGLILPLLKAMSGLTFAAGLVYFIIKNNIQKKTVSLNMAFGGLLIYMLTLNNFSWMPLFSYYITIVYFVNLLIFKIYLYQNREENISEMLNCSELNTPPLSAILIMMTIIANIFTVTALKLAEALSSSLPAAGIGCILFALCIVLSHIYKSPHCRRLDYLNPNTLRILSFIINFAIILSAGAYFRIYGLPNLFFTLIFLGLIALPLWQRFRPLYNLEKLQREDISKSLLEYLLVSPFRYISRMLWLVVDFIFSERIITAAISATNHFGVSVFFKINKKSHIASLLFFLLGIAVFALSFYERIKP